MQKPADFPIFSADDMRALAPETAASMVNQLAQDLTDSQQRADRLQHQVDWFKRQLFGAKSEKRHDAPPAEQASLGGGFAPVPENGPSAKKRPVAGYEREEKPKTQAGDESSLFFDESKVPVEIIPVANPEVAGLAPEAYTVIGEKVSYRLAQRPGSYVVLKYVRPLVKLRESERLSCPPAPRGVIEGSRADVSFIAGVLIDKLVYHLPLYRQHQRLQHAGFKVSRPWLTQLVQKSISLLEPVFQALFQSVRQSRVLAMDETPLKAGVAKPGTMKQGYIWPVYGERNEIVFLYYPSRASEHVLTTLGRNPREAAVLLSDGYAAYTRYAQITGIAHAQCWNHTRRKFIDAEPIEPDKAGEALDMIGELYRIEAEIKAENLSADAKRQRRQTEARPVVARFFAWIDQQFDAQDFLPSSPLTTALGYARERRAGLEVYLDDPDVQIDTNHLEQLLRAIAMGRRNWLFAWTELGAKHIGMMQSLLVTCRLHGIDPYEYLVDVLQRIGQHPASRVEELTPRRWKELFADNPLRSDLYHISEKRNNAG